MSIYPAAQFAQKPRRTEALRSSVRPKVTYSVIGIHTLPAAFAAVCWLVRRQTRNSFGPVFGIAGDAAGVLGFWFGTRGQGGVPTPKPPADTDEVATDGQQTAELCNPRAQTIDAPAFPSSSIGWLLSGCREPGSAKSFKFTFNTLTRSGKAAKPV